MMGRILAVTKARNIEFLRDRSSLGWNIVMPVLLVFGLAFIFSGEDTDQFNVSVLGGEKVIAAAEHPFFATRYINFVPAENMDDAVQNVARHQIDLLLDPGGAERGARYWINPDSPTGYIVEKLLLEADPEAAKQTVTGEAVRYVDWLVPGVLGMNMMFSCLFGVGYVVVRYRKNGFLKRLRATPLMAVEFIVAQVLSRLMLVMAVTAVVFIGIKLLLDVAMEGSYFALILVALLGASALISLSLVVAARIDSEEFAGGVLNLVSWPMMLLSGVFFSLEGSAQWLQSAAQVMPLTQMLVAARAVMIDGAGLAEVLPQLAILTGMTALFLALGAGIFKWRFT